MQEIENLKRQRYIKMLNLLPPMIAEKQAPTFFYHAFQRYIDWDSINLSHIKLELPQRDDPTFKLRRKITAQKNRIQAMKMMGQQKTLKVDNDIHLLDNERQQDVNPIPFCPYSLQRAALYDKGCLTCGKANIIVKYHRDRHICLQCRQKITTLNDDPVMIFQDDDGEVVVMAISENNQKRTAYFVNPDELKIFGYRCYVTFSAPDDLIILLHDSLNEHRGRMTQHDMRQQAIQSWNPQPNKQKKARKKNFLQLNKMKYTKIKEQDQNRQSLQGQQNRLSWQQNIQNSNEGQRQKQEIEQNSPKRSIIRTKSAMSSVKKTVTYF